VVDYQAWNTYDLSAAHFFQGQYDGSAIIYGGGWPNYYFPSDGPVLVPGFHYQFEATFDPNHPWDDGSNYRYIAIGGFRPEAAGNTSVADIAYPDDMAWYEYGYSFGEWYDSFDESSDPNITFITTGPGLHEYDSIINTFPVVFFESDSRGAISQIRWRAEVGAGGGDPPDPVDTPQSLTVGIPGRRSFRPW
jgi:hypothetical protein